MDNDAIQRDEIIDEIIGSLRNEKIHTKNQLDKYNARLKVQEEIINRLLEYKKWD